MSEHPPLPSPEQQDGLIQGLENDFTGLKWIHRFGFLRPKEIGLLIWGDVEHSERYGKRICAKWFKKNYVLKRELPENAGSAFVLATAGIKFLAERGIRDAKSGKDWGMMKQKVWSPPREWRHHTIASGFLAKLHTRGLEIYSENELRQTGWEGKIPDGIYIIENQAFWIELENHRKTGSDMISMVENIIKLAKKEKKFRGAITFPVVVFPENFKDERGHALNHRERVINAIRKITKEDITLKFIKLEISGVTVVGFKEEDTLIEADEVSVELKNMEKERTERAAFNMLNHGITEETENKYVYYVKEKLYTIDTKSFLVECDHVQIHKFLSMTMAKRFLAKLRIDQEKMDIEEEERKRAARGGRQIPFRPA